MYYFSSFRGMYLCRTLSYKGAEFNVVEVPLEDDMMVYYSLLIDSYWVGVFLRYLFE